MGESSQRGGWPCGHMCGGGGGGLVAKLCLTLVTPWTVARQAPLSMGFPRKNTGVGCISFSRGSS